MRLSVLVPVGFIFVILLPGRVSICIGAYGVCIRHSLTWACAYLVTNRLSSTLLLSSSLTLIDLPMNSCSMDVFLL